MQRVAVAVDSGLDIPGPLLEEYGIYQIPVHVNWQGKQYRDKVDLQVEALFSLGKGGKGFPTTSQPSPGEFIDFYSSLLEKADVILSWHIASGLSGTWAAAKAGAKMTGGDIRVIDTRSVSMGGGLAALAAASILQQGGDAEEALKTGMDVCQQVQVRVVLDTLDYVLRGGRISRVEATVGSLLNIKPMLAVQDGAITSVGRSRSRKRSLEQLWSTILKGCVSEDGKNFVLAVGHACADSDIKFFISQVQDALPKATVIPYKVGIAIGAHGGPGVLGAAYYNTPTR